MGYSVRSDGFRYTLFVAWDGTALKPRWDQVWGEELYDHRTDRYAAARAFSRKIDSGVTSMLECSFFFASERALALEMRFSLVCLHGRGAFLKVA